MCSRRALLVGSFVGALAACDEHRSASIPAVAPLSVDLDAGARRCAIGDLGKTAKPLQPSEAADRIAELEGQDVALQGYLLLQFERSVLVDTSGKVAVFLSFEDIGPTSSDAVAACRNKLVTVRGTLARTHRRGGDTVVLRSKAIAE